MFAAWKIPKDGVVTHHESALAYTHLTARCFPAPANASSVISDKVRILDSSLSCHNAAIHHSTSQTTNFSRGSIRIKTISQGKMAIGKRTADQYLAMDDAKLDSELEKVPITDNCDVVR
jgi:hypothetical protein